MNLFLMSIITSVVTLAFIVFMMAVVAKNRGVPNSNNETARGFTVMKYNMSLNDMCGYEEVKNEVRDIIEIIKNRDKYENYGVRIPKGVLLYGPPGTGKTLLAKAISGECGMSFIPVCGSSFEEKYVGVGAARIRDLFKTARTHAPCIIFIDEIDAVGFGRSQSPDFGYHAQTINQLLAEMDGINQNDNVIVIAATNMLDSLDKALLRPGRFDRIVHVPLPNKEERKEIFKYHMRNKPCRDIDYDKLALITYGMSGAEIENITNEAAIEAAKKASEITMDDLQTAVRKVMVGSKKASYRFSWEEKFRIAVHETSHALFCHLFGRKINKISIIPTNKGALGYVHHGNEQDGEGILETKEYILDSVRIALAGRAAEEVITGDVSVGSSSDLIHASNLVKRLIEGGMHDTLFVLHQTASIVAKANKIMEHLYHDVKRVVESNAEKICRIAETLISKEEMDEEEFVAMLTGE